MVERIKGAPLSIEKVWEEEKEIERWLTTASSHCRRSLRESGDLPPTEKRGTNVEREMQSFL